jgi:hypothetical protein
MSDLHEAFVLQDMLEQVGEHIKVNPRNRSYLTPDGGAYVLALGGDDAKAMHAFMRAVGQYLVKTENGTRDQEAAKREVLHAFNEWLSKQHI